jgi:cell division protein FtsB
MNFRLALSILLFFVLLAGIHLYFYTQNITLTYKITDLKTKLNGLKSDNRQLSGQVSRGENLSYVEEYALKKLGMIYPGQITYIVGTAEVIPKPSSLPGQTAAKD